MLLLYWLILLDLYFLSNSFSLCRVFIFFSFRSSFVFASCISWKPQPITTLPFNLSILFLASPPPNTYKTPSFSQPIKEPYAFISSYLFTYLLKPACINLANKLRPLPPIDRQSNPLFSKQHLITNQSLTNYNAAENESWGRRG